MSSIYLGWILGILTVILFAATGPSEQLTIQISNPYSFDVNAEVKCDWNEEKKTFDFHKEFLFPAESLTKIIIPKAQQSCEIWPHVNLFD